MRTVRASVVVLVDIGTPRDVSWFVPEVVIEPIERVCRGGSLSDVREERREIVHPTFVDGDPSTTVVWVCPMIRVQAAGFELLPRLVLGGLAQTMFDVHDLKMTLKPP
jgi:hypothetical protein